MVFSLESTERKKQNTVGEFQQEPDLGLFLRAYLCLCLYRLSEQANQQLHTGVRLLLDFIHGVLLLLSGLLRENHKLLQIKDVDGDGDADDSYKENEKKPQEDNR